MVKDSKFEKSGAGKVRAWSWNVLQLRLNRIGKYWWRSRCFWNQICENPGWKVGGGFFIGSHTKFGIFSRRNSNCLSRRFGMFYKIILTAGFWGKEAWCPTPKWNKDTSPITRFSYTVVFYIPWFFKPKLGFHEEIDCAAVANVLQRQTKPAHSPPGSKSFKKKVLRWDPLMKQNLRFGLVRPGQVNSFPDLCTFWFQEKLRSTKYALVGL